MISGSLWNYQRDEIDNINDNASYGKSFKYKTKTVGKTPQRHNLKTQEMQTDQNHLHQL